MGETIEITTVAIDPVNNNINNLEDTVDNSLSTPEPQESELYIEADTNSYTDFYGVSVPQIIGTDTDGQLRNPNPLLSDRSAATFHLFEFRDDTNEVDMNGESVTITVTYELLGGGTGSKMFTVASGATNSNEQLDADFTIDGAGESGNVKFDASPSRGDIVTYEWDFDGDGIFETETEKEKINTNDVSSDTTVALRVVDSGGNADTVRKEVP